MARMKTRRRTATRLGTKSDTAIAMSDSARPPTTQVLKVVMSVVVLGGTIFLLVEAVSWLINFLKGLEPEVAAALVIGPLTVIASVLAVVLQKHGEFRAKIDEEHRRRKRALYRQFTEIWFRTIFGERVGLEKPTEEELLTKFAKFTKDAMVWASDEFIREFNAWKSSAAIDALRQELGEEGNFRESALGFERLLLTIRKDLGHSNSGLKPGDLLRMLLRDADEFLR